MAPLFRACDFIRAEIRELVKVRESEGRRKVRSAKREVYIDGVGARERVPGVNEQRRPAAALRIH